MVVRLVRKKSVSPRMALQVWQPGKSIIVEMGSIFFWLFLLPVKDLPANIGGES
jgi:hypothetical protein